jgi:hypothetical protein
MLLDIIDKTLDWADKADTAELIAPERPMAKLPDDYVDDLVDDVFAVSDEDMLETDSCKLVRVLFIDVIELFMFVICE